MVQKRPAAAVARGHAKKQRLDPITQKCNVVACGLEKAVEVEAVPEATVEMLQNMLEDSLAIAKDARHAFQESVIDMVLNVLGQTEEALSKAVGDAQGAVDAGVSARAEREAAVQTAQEQVAASQTETQSKKVALADSATVFKRNKEAVREAQEAQSAVASTVKDATTKKGKLEGTLKDLVAPLVEGSVPEAEVGGRVAALKAALAKFQVVESLVTAVPTVLSKKPADRQEFDGMVVAQLNDELGKRVAELDAKIGEVNSTGEERAKATEAAEAAFEEAKAGQLTAADAFTSARDALNEAKAELQQKEKQLKELWPAEKKNKRTFESAVAELQLFRDGALAASQELKGRVTPPPEPQPTAEPAEQALADAGAAMEDAGAAAEEAAA